MKKRVVVDSDDDEFMPVAKRGKASEFDASGSSGGGRRRSVEDEYVCPITLELFIDPVTAEDGQVYERAAIFRMFEECRKSNNVAGHEGNEARFRSPMSNAPMGSQLFPAHQVRSALAALIAARVVTGERAKTWQTVMDAKEHDRARLAGLKQASESGDAKAMLVLGRVFDKGELGVASDPIQAFAHYQKAALAGALLYMGRGADANRTLAERYMFAAALMGSEHACEHVGNAHANGSFDYPMDEAEALVWYKLMRKCTVKDSVHACRERARAFLQKHGEWVE